MRMLHRAIVLLTLFGCVSPSAGALAEEQEGDLRCGIIGLDTSHVLAFTELLNGTHKDLAGCRVVAAYPQGSQDIESSVSRVPAYTKRMRGMGVEIVASIDQLLNQVDVVLLETNDGRPHLEQIQPVLQAGKPVFVDKPVAGSLTDAITIYDEARRHNVPLFSSSSLRFSREVVEVSGGAIGQIVGCDAYSPCILEETHPDLFWYGIHGVETLFTVMGRGCRQVVRVKSPGADVAVGTWEDGRLGTFRGLRDGHRGNGGTAFGSDGIRTFGRPDRYLPLLREIVKFFRTGEPPVTAEETLEIYAFMEAADESLRRGGVPVRLAHVLRDARSEAKLVAPRR